MRSSRQRPYVCSLVRGQVVRWLVTLIPTLWPTSTLVLIRVYNHQLTWYNSLWLCRQLPRRFSERQSLSTTTVLFTTTFTSINILSLLMKWLTSSNLSWYSFYVAQTLLFVLIKKINWRDNTQFDSEDKYRTGFSKCQSLSTTTVLFRATFSRLAMMFILKHSKSTWRQLTILRKLQNQNIKSSGHNACSALLYHSNVQERSIYDNCCFHIESFRASRLITKVSTHE